MDFLDYREKLGFGSNDDQKYSFFRQKIFNVLDCIDEYETAAKVTSTSYYKFCNTCGVKMDKNILYSDYFTYKRFCECVRILHEHSESLHQFLLYYISFVNSVDYDSNVFCDRLFLVGTLRKMLQESHIKYEVLEDNKEFFAFPKGAKELDNALVSEPLMWLESYPKTHSTFCRALKQYSDGEHTRDVADNFRKALEEFLQEYLGNSKNLENNKSEICRYLSSKGVDAEFGGLLQPLLNTYKKINDKYAKHNDAMDERLLEFIMYQTGVFIRMIISVK